MSNISKERLLGLTIILPPIKLQEQFAAFVEQVDKSKVVVQKAVSKNINTSFIWGGQHYD